MKLIREYKDLNDAEELSSLLRDKGVMTFVSSKESINIHMSRGGASHVGVWAVLPNQYQDAVNLLNNEGHVVQFPLSLEEMENIKTQTAFEQSQNLDKVFTKLITIGLTLILILLAGFIIYNLGSDV